MRLCELQKIVIFLVVIVAIAVGAYLYRFLDLASLLATLIGEGSVSLLVYLLLRERHKNVEKEKMIEAKKAFCKWFHFFPNKWVSYKQLIKSRSIVKPEIEQPNTIADQLRFSFQDAKSSGFKFNSEIKEKIHRIINRLDKFGYDLRQIMPRIREHDLSVVSKDEIRDTLGDSTIKDFIKEGEAIVRAIKEALEDVEKSLEIK